MSFVYDKSTKRSFPMVYKQHSPDCFLKGASVGWGHLDCVTREIGGNDKVEPAQTPEISKLETSRSGTCFFPISLAALKNITGQPATKWSRVVRNSAAPEQLFTLMK